MKLVCIFISGYPRSGTTMVLNDLNRLFDLKLLLEPNILSGIGKSKEYVSIADYKCLYEEQLLRVAGTVTSEEINHAQFIGDKSLHNTFYLNRLSTNGNNRIYGVNVIRNPVDCVNSNLIKRGLILKNSSRLGSVLNFSLKWVKWNMKMRHEAKKSNFDIIQLKYEDYSNLNDDEKISYWKNFIYELNISNAKNANISLTEKELYLMGADKYHVNLTKDRNQINTKEILTIDEKNVIESLCAQEASKYGYSFQPKLSFFSLIALVGIKRYLYHWRSIRKKF